MPVTKVISGGQTGADQAGLTAAMTLGLETGGWVSVGFRTENGPFRGLATLGLQEHGRGYKPRTIRNVRSADGTVWFGRTSSPGAKLTMGEARRQDTPLFVVRAPTPSTQQAFRTWARDWKIETLNVAGNRESTNPGIHQWVHDFLVSTL
tara:strand:+ start:272 stop:721 length:450 start_codon:yes stop_codon:yes gene_type:complete